MGKNSPVVGMTKSSRRQESFSDGGIKNVGRERGKHLPMFAIKDTEVGKKYEDEKIYSFTMILHITKLQNQKKKVRLHFVKSKAQGS